ncbi:glycoside hydrolase/deacetylase [Anaeromyces robustus]|uniref:Glycoside hydrolase/deacetylase n=1 Tax=Anaeromyces robustus TaxID=1754192 RepID=A0A1Y1XCJ0_9FUNG|nr:glycoside hydrolase/deacetylase [Anaeromyces robustus]|eukprot:ORX83435.1 glycoside hydrolase/deacetylase [Anaeromyces robustus]
MTTFSLSNAAIRKIDRCVNSGDFALTFDDGPSLEFTSKVLDVLDKENVKATFFINGMNTCDLKNDPEAAKLVKREFESGHVIASHTYSHPVNGITGLSDEELTKEIQTLNDIIQELIGVKPAFFRPPLGEVTDANEVILEKTGMTADILWNLDSEDWNVQYNATQQYYDLLKNADPKKDSFIALNHDIQKITATKNLEIVIPYIKSLGFNFVTMDVCTGMNAYQDGATNPNIINNEISRNPISGNATDPNVIPSNSNTNSTNNDLFNLNNEKSGTMQTQSFTFALAFVLVLFNILFNN